jgi:hypothetical protein
MNSGEQFSKRLRSTKECNVREEEEEDDDD